MITDQYSDKTTMSLTAEHSYPLPIGHIEKSYISKDWFKWRTRNLFVGGKIKFGKDIFVENPEIVIRSKIILSFRQFQYI